MTRALRLLLLVAWAVPGATRAQQAAPPDARDASAAVAGLAAVRLGVRPERVEVEWAGRDTPPSAGDVRLLGSGVGGAYVAELDVAGRVVRRRVRVGVRTSLPVAARDLERGAVLAEADLARRDTVIWGSRAPIEVEVGWVARRRIPTGGALMPPAVSPPTLVRPGQPVTLVWRGGRIEVTTQAVAAGEAAAGERVAVRTESGRRLWGIAESPGRVRIEGSGQ